MAIPNLIPLLSGCFACGDEAAGLLASEMHERRYEHRAPIAHIGDASSELLLVVEGAALAEIFGIDGQHAQLARHGPGEIFGAYPHPAIHRSDLTASGSTVLLAVPAHRLASLAATNAEIGAGLSTLLARQLDLLLDRLSARIGLSATGRFYRALLNLADDDGRICPHPVIAAVALSVHTTRETGSRALATLTRRGIVERHDDHLQIVSRRMLEDLIT